jgi:putative acyl-CoA dehydrogenase
MAIVTATESTHEVFNQPQPLTDTNLFRIDTSLAAAVTAFDGGWGLRALERYGALAGGELARHGRLANRNPPELKTHDAYGRRLDEVDFHPSYHALMRNAIAHGVHSLAWETPRTGAHVVRAVLELLHNQADSGTDCPLTMTYAGLAAIRVEPAVAAQWEPKVLSRTYDARLEPLHTKQGATLGMAMTEKQGGSDVRSNTSHAIAHNDRLDGGETFRLTGHKWFCSAPMSDAFLTLAQLDAGLTCFLMPRVLPDGRRNSIHLMRLKDKLGNRSNASSEIEFRDALAVRIGEPGGGVRTIIRMVALTRFNCMVGSTAIMRHAALQAHHHVHQRQVSGTKLSEQPLMRNVVADLILESEAALWMSLRVARAIDDNDDPQAMAFVRLVTALGKYWICKRTPQQVNEAAECLGGLGYVEDSVLPRLYREAPVNSIWEGSGNVQCLDIRRTIDRQPEAIDVFLDEIELAKGANRPFDELAAKCRDGLRISDSDPFAARAAAERMALLLQASLLIRYADGAVANAFVRSRLTEPSLAFGGLRDADAATRLLQRFDMS